MKTFKFSILVLLVGLFTYSTSLAQNENEVKNFRMLYKFNTFKQADGSRLLEVSFIARHKKDRKNKVPVFDAEINFYNETEDDNILIGKAKTDKEGFARLTIPSTEKLIADSEGYINFIAEFEKTDAIKRYKKSIAVKELFLDLTLEEIDSVKTVQLKAYTLDSIQNKVPVSEVDVVFSVKGMLSNMPIERGTIEDGEYEFEFPENIPGDAKGNIQVRAFIEDDFDFINVTQEKTINWGTANQVSLEKENTLWSDAAPIWMYIVLTILLVGIWANFAYTIINLNKIKKEGKELELKTEES
jgi:hypothetical protein